MTTVAQKCIITGLSAGIAFFGALALYTLKNLPTWTPAATDTVAPANVNDSASDPYLQQRLTAMLEESETMYRSAYLMGAKKASDERDMFIAKVAKLNYYGATYVDVSMVDEDDKRLSDDGMRQQRSNYRSGYASVMNELLRGDKYKVQFLGCYPDQCIIRVYFLKQQ